MMMVATIIADTRSVARLSADDAGPCLLMMARSSAVCTCANPGVLLNCDMEPDTVWSAPKYCSRENTSAWRANVFIWLPLVLGVEEEFSRMRYAHSLSVNPKESNTTPMRSGVVDGVVA